MFLFCDQQMLPSARTWFLIVGTGPWSSQPSKHVQQKSNGWWQVNLKWRKTDLGWHQIALLDSFALVWDLFKVVGQLKWDEMMWDAFFGDIASNPQGRIGPGERRPGHQRQGFSDCKSKTSARMYEDDLRCTKCSWSWAAWMWKGLWLMTVEYELTHERIMRI